MIENSRSDLKLLNAFERHEYIKKIGPSLYNIYSLYVSSTKELKTYLQAIFKYILKNLIWMNSDCGLKTHGWPKVKAALKNMTDVTKGFYAIKAGY